MYSIIVYVGNKESADHCFVWRALAHWGISTTTVFSGSRVSLPCIHRRLGAFNYVFLFWTFFWHGKSFRPQGRRPLVLVPPSPSYPPIAHVPMHRPASRLLCISTRICMYVVHDVEIFFTLLFLSLSHSLSIARSLTKFLPIPSTLIRPCAL